MKKNRILLVWTLSFLALSASISMAVTISTAGPNVGSLTGDVFGHVSDFTVGGNQHITYVSHFLMVDGGAPVEVIQGGPFVDIVDEAQYFEPGAGNYQYANQISDNGGNYVLAFGVNLRDPSRSSSSMVSWEPTFQITNTSGNPITFETMRYTQGVNGVNGGLSATFSNSDGIAGSADDVAVFVRTDGSRYFDPYGLTTSRQLDTGGALLVQIQGGGPGFALNNNTANVAPPAESAFITEPFTIPPGGRIISGLIKEVTHANVVYTLNPLDVQIEFSNVGSSGDSNAGGLVIIGEHTGVPLGGVDNVDATLEHVSSVRRWTLATTIVSGSGATADITFGYDPAGDGITNENTLELATRNLLTDQWTAWPNVVRNPAANIITAVGIGVDELDNLWTLGSTGDNPLPVSLSSFATEWTPGGVRLSWQTQTETHNLGFTVYRGRTPKGPFEPVAFIPSQSEGGPTAYEFVDDAAIPGQTYWYYIQDRSWTGESDEVRSKILVAIPTETLTSVAQTLTSSLHANFPNPFNPDTWIPYELNHAADVSVTIYDVHGKLVRRLNVGHQTPGIYQSKQHAVHWDGRDEAGESVASGVYYYTLHAGEFVATRRMLLRK